MSTPPFIFELFFAAGLTALGLVVGSFLNVVIARLPAGESIVRPRSRCQACLHSLPWYENIPLFSWLFLRGRCSACGAPISWRYPFVELITALLFLACLRRFDWTWELAAALMLVTLLVPLTFIDLEHWLLPFALTLPGIALGILFAAPLGLERVRDSAIGVAAGFLGFWGMEWLGRKVFNKEALGGGDKYLLAMLGAFLTYKALLGVVFLASLQGAIVGSILLLIFGRAGPAPTEADATDSSPASSLAPAPSAPAENPEAPAGPEQSAVASSNERRTEEQDWQPGPTNLPYGPWLSIAAVELMLLGPWLTRVVPWRAAHLFVGEV